MTADEWLRKETREWVDRAEGDLRVAGLCLADLSAEALFHCRQAAEKYPKAFLTWRQIAFRKTHDLPDLRLACGKVEQELENAIEPADSRSKYAWLFPYPGAPYEPDVEQARRGRELARKVRSEIRKRLPSEALGR